MFWESEELFLDELIQLLGKDFHLREGHVFEIRELLDRYRLGKARPRVEFKRMVGFADHDLFELRFDLSNLKTMKKVRLLVAHRDDAILILFWHVKFEGDSDVSRRLQNDACDQAIIRLKEMGFDIDNNQT